MLKRIFIFISIAVIIFVVNYLGFTGYIQTNNLTTNIDVLKISSFHLISSLIIYLSIEGLLKVVPNETGFLFLTLIMVKMGVFILIFQGYIFNTGNISGINKAILTIPFLMFLFLETIASAKLLNNFENNNNNFR